MDLIEPMGFSSQQLMGFSGNGNLYFEAGGAWPDGSIPFPRLVTYSRTDWGFPVDWHQCFIRHITEVPLALNESVDLNWYGFTGIKGVWLTATGVDISFGQIEFGEEVSYTDVFGGIHPVVSFDESSRHFEVRFQGVSFRPEIAAYLPGQRGNTTVTACRLVQDGVDSLLLLELTEHAQYYVARLGETDDYLSLIFTSDREMPYLHPGTRIR
jgi:hypothetical protein